MLLRNTTASSKSYISTFGNFSIPASSDKEVCDSTVSVCPEALADITSGVLVVLVSLVPPSILDVNASVTVGELSIEDPITHKFWV